MPLYALSLLLLLPLCSRAQQEIVSSGGSGNGQGGTLEFSFGQVFDTYSQNEDNSVTEGVQQTYCSTSRDTITASVCS